MGMIFVQRPQKKGMIFVQRPPKKGMIFVQRPQTHGKNWVFEMNFRVPHQAKYMVSWIVPIFQSHSDAVGTAHR